MKTEEMFVKSDSVIPGRFRPVWNFERKFIKSPAANVSVVARVRGAIAPEQMKKALYKLQEIHPLLRSRIVEDPDHNAYLHTDDVPDISLQVIKRISDKHWYDALVEEHKIPFNSIIGPLVRFKLLLSDDPKQPSELIIFCQHTICDGTALANCIRDLCEALRRSNPPIHIRCTASHAGRHTTARPGFFVSAKTRSHGRHESKMEGKSFYF
jgi:hypothetical protein